jgi:hypothetical protein
MRPSFADPANLEREWGREPAVAPRARALEFLQAVYQNELVPLGVRMRAAIECLPFEQPKLSATAVITGGEDFEARLKRAIARSRELKLIEHIPEAAPSADHRPGSAPTIDHRPFARAGPAK